MSGARIWIAALQTVFVGWFYYAVMVAKRGWDADWFWGVLIVTFILAMLVPLIVLKSGRPGIAQTTTTTTTV